MFVSLASSAGRSQAHALGHALVGSAPDCRQHGSSRLLFVPLVPAADDDSSASKKPDPLDRLRVALSSAEQELAESAAVAEELKGKVAAMEKLVEVHRKRVDKKRKKLQRKVERAQRKKVRISLSHTHS